MFKMCNSIYFLSLFACPKSNQKGHHENQPLARLCCTTCPWASRACGSHFSWTTCAPIEATFLFANCIFYCNCNCHWYFFNSLPLPPPPPFDAPFLNSGLVQGKLPLVLLPFDAPFVNSGLAQGKLLLVLLPFDAPFVNSGLAQGKLLLVLLLELFPNDQ